VENARSVFGKDLRRRRPVRKVGPGPTLQTASAELEVTAERIAELRSAVELGLRALSIVLPKVAAARDALYAARAIRVGRSMALLSK